MTLEGKEALLNLARKTTKQIQSAKKTCSTSSEASKIYAISIRTNPKRSPIMSVGISMAQRYTINTRSAYKHLLTNTAEHTSKKKLYFSTNFDAISFERMISLTCDSLFRRLVSRLRLHCPRCGSRVINNNCTASCLDHGLLLLAGHPVILTAINGHVLSTLYFIHLSLGSHQKISLCWITAFCYFASCSDLLALKLLNTHRLGDRPAGYMLNWLSSDRNVLRVLHVYLCLCKFWNLLLLLVINARAAYPVFLSFCSIRLLITICV